MNWKQIRDNQNYLGYLEEIRKKLHRLVIFFVASFVVGFFLAGPILSFLIKIMKINNVTIVTTAPFQFIDLAMNVGLSLAVLACLPLIVYQFYDFLRDGLKPREKRLFFLLLPLGCLLFITGFVYGFVVLYYALDVIASLNSSLGIANLWDINRFLSQIIFTSALLGIIFEFPIVLSFLIRLGVFDQGFLKEKRRHAYVAIVILVSLLPPTDGLSLIVMSAPLILIYELTVAFNSRWRQPVIQESIIN